MTDDENQQLDHEIVDQDRQAQLPDLADAVLSELDWERRAEAERAQEQLERQMADLEREQPDKSLDELLALWESNREHLRGFSSAIEQFRASRRRPA